jgi:uncharacterized repeat protein (TIGR01451 family)
MKKNIALFILLFISVFANSQTLNISVPNPATIQGGVDFSVGIQVTNPTNNCTQTIKLEIGNLEYVSGNLPSGAYFATNYTSNPRILTIGNLYNVTGGAQSQNFNLLFKLPMGTACNNQTVTINGAILSSPCSPLSIVAPQKQLTASVTPLSPNNFDTNVFQTNYTSTTNCYGKLLKYKVYAKKNINTNNITSCKYFLELPKCSDFRAVYIGDSYEPVSGMTFTTTGAISTLSWDITAAQLQNMNLGGQTAFDVYVRFPCNSNCIQAGQLNIDSYIQAVSVCGTSTITSTKKRTQTPFTNVNCSGSCSVPDLPKLFETTSSSESLCPTACNATGFVMKLNFDIPPTHVINNKTELIVSIPTGIKIKHAFIMTPVVLSPNVSCPITYEAEYGGTWHTINLGIPLGNGADNLTLLNVTRVKFILNCNTKPLLVKDVTLNCVYDSVPVSATNISFPYTVAFDSPSQPITSSTITKSIACNPLTLRKTVFKDIAKNPNNPLAITSPGDIVTYTLEIRNNGSNAISNIIIDDILNTNLVYKGDFKYAYSNSTSPVYTNLNNNQIPVSLGLGLGTVVTPALGANTPPIEISGLTLPIGCGNTEKLYLQFDAQLSENIFAGTQIPNSFAVKRNGGVLQNAYAYITMTTIKKISPTMFVKCNNSNDWSNTVNVRNGEIVDFKMQFKNRGSVPVKLKELINLKPQVEDVFEYSSTLTSTNRLSDFKIKYQCLPIVTLPSGITANYRYSVQPVTMSIFNGPAPVWQPSCNSDTTNWLDIEFPNGGQILNPGNSVEIIYSGIVTGSNNQIARNSFSFKATEEDGTTAFGSINSNTVVINNNGEGCNPLPPCYDCSSFDLRKTTPQLVSKYLVSGWVREEDPTTPEKQFKNYLSSIKISFTDVGGALITTPQLDTTPGVTIPGNPEFFPTGEIIDGWQRIVGEFIVPNNVDDMKLELINKNANGTMAYFDDIRVLPSNGNMKSFVYDQKTQRLMAELDENNYSTFYEYDLEGGLIRIKKETEKGVFTIQETRSGNVKK